MERSLLLNEEIKDLWSTFDAGYKHSNDRMLIEKLSTLVNKYTIGDERDLRMLADLSGCLDEGGFLVREEKLFLVNYAIFLAGARYPELLPYMRGSSSVLDLWHTGLTNRTDYAKKTVRKEFLILFIRMYELLGNTFLQKKGLKTSHYGFDLIKQLTVYKCRLHRDEYATASEFFISAELVIRHNEICTDMEPCFKVMRKMVWKIREGLTKYS